MYLTDQSKFLNAAILCSTQLDEFSLLNKLKEIEKEFGRKASAIRYGPRPLDLDIIFYGDQEINHENLIIPHLK